MSTRSLKPDVVFLNCPYDKTFEPLYLAYIVGLVDLSLEPVATLGIPSDASRIDRIYDLIRSSTYSIHDLSRVELEKSEPRVPRFNMPFELGLAVAWNRESKRRHKYFVFEAVNRRGHKSLSDMAGTDFYIHENTPSGVMRELCSVFVRETRRPKVPDMMRHYEQLKNTVPSLLKESGTDSVFSGRAFHDIVTMAKRISDADAKSKAQR